MANHLADGQLSPLVVTGRASAPSCPPSARTPSRMQHAVSDPELTRHNENSGRSHVSDTPMRACSPPRATKLQRALWQIVFNERTSSDLDWLTAKLIGSGSFGRVYRVNCAGLGVIAAKVVPNPPTLSERRVAQKRMRHEARVLAMHRHPHIVLM